MSGRRHGNVYTDGACSNNGRNGASAGAGVWWGEGHPDNTSAPVYGRQTNNNAEIQAAEIAVRQAGERGYDSVTVHTDSEFTVKCQEQWVPKWESNGWRTSNGEPVKNREELQSLNQAVRESGMDVQFQYTPGHSGIRGNEEADRLARRGANRY